MGNVLLPAFRLKIDFLENYPKTVWNVTATCKKIGISRESFYRWLDEDPEFKAKVLSQIEVCGDSLEGLAHLMALVDKDPDMVKFLLKTKFKNRGYTEKQEIEHTGESVQILQLKQINLTIMQTLSEFPEIKEKVLGKLDKMPEGEVKSVN